MNTFSKKSTKFYQEHLAHKNPDIRIRRANIENQEQNFKLSSGSFNLTQSQNFVEDKVYNGGYAKNIPTILSSSSRNSATHQNYDYPLNQYDDNRPTLPGPRLWIEPHQMKLYQSDETFYTETSLNSSPNLVSPTYLSFPEQKAATLPKCRVLIVHVTNWAKITIQSLAVIFGLFGNVVCILENIASNTPKNKETITRKQFFIQMETQKHAKNSINEIKSRFIFGERLQVDYSTKYPWEIESRGRDLSQGFYKEKEENQRYGKMPRVRQNPSSSMLHLTSVPANITIEHLETLFGQVANPIKVERLSKPAKDSAMYHLTFDSVDTALTVIGSLHNTSFNDRTLKLSFTQRPTKK